LPTVGIKGIAEGYVTVDTLISSTSQSSSGGGVSLLISLNATYWKKL